MRPAQTWPRKLGTGALLIGRLAGTASSKVMLSSAMATSKFLVGKSSSRPFHTFHFICCFFSHLRFYQILLFRCHCFRGHGRSRLLLIAVSLACNLFRLSRPIRNLSQIRDTPPIHRQDHLSTDFEIFSLAPIPINRHLFVAYQSSSKSRTATLNSSVVDVDITFGTVEITAQSGSMGR